MNKKQKNKLIWVGVSIGILIIAGLLYWQKNRPGELDGFARCIEEKDATFYGAFWCPHCKDQKALFGASTKYLPYIECSTPDGQSQTQVCKDKGIVGYPTWIFANGNRQSGVVSLEDLSATTSCVLPSTVTN